MESLLAAGAGGIGVAAAAVGGFIAAATLAVAPPKNRRNPPPGNRPAGPVRRSFDRSIAVFCRPLPGLWIYIYLSSFIEMLEMACS